jgi:hypothetical protein
MRVTSYVLLKIIESCCLVFSIPDDSHGPNAQSFWASCNFDTILSNPVSAFSQTVD